MYTAVFVPATQREHETLETSGNGVPLATTSLAIARGQRCTFSSIFLHLVKIVAYERVLCRLALSICLIILAIEERAVGVREVVSLTFFLTLPSRFDTVAPLRLRERLDVDLVSETFTFCFNAIGILYAFLLCRVPDVGSFFFPVRTRAHWYARITLRGLFHLLVVVRLGTSWQIFFGNRAGVVDQARFGIILVRAEEAHLRVWLCWHLGEAIDEEGWGVEDQQASRSSCHLRRNTCARVGGALANPIT